MEERQTAARPPEIRFWMHVLRRGIWDFVLHRNSKPGTEQHAWAEDAAGWIWWDGEEDLDIVGRPTFRYVCDILDIDHRRVRQAALRLRPEDAADLGRALPEDD